jgi:hypothetical protein
VFLADRLCLSLLQKQKGFETLRRELHRAPARQGALLDKRFRQNRGDGRGAAGGADVLVTREIERRGKDVVVTVTATKVATAEPVARQSWQVARADFLDAFARQPIRADTPFCLLGQDGVTVPACTYCPNPKYSEAARKRKIEGMVVLMVLIDASGLVQDAWEGRVGDPRAS